jgi:hypothetical protein
MSFGIPDLKLVAKPVVPNLLQVITHINNMSSHQILHIEGKNVTRSIWEVDIHIHINLRFSVVKLLDLQNIGHFVAEELTDLSEHDGDDDQSATDADDHAARRPFRHVLRQPLEEVK